MCGIIGYIGERQAQPILLNGLKLLEYRGYDSAGCATFSEDKKVLCVRKLPGKVRDLESLLKKKPLLGSLGIGHCLAPDTNVFLSDGRIKKIAELNNREGVISIEPTKLICRNSNKIKIFCHESPPSLYHVKTSYFSFVATDRHRIFVAEPSGEIVEREVGKINGGLIAMPRRLSSIDNAKRFRLKDVFVERHFVITTLGRAKLRRIRQAKGHSLKEVERLTGVRSEYIRRIENGERTSIEKTRLEQLLKYYGINFSPHLFKSKNYITNDLYLPEFTSNELMQILGYFIGDGHITQRMIRFKESDKQICKIYQGLFKKVFNIDSKLKKQKGHYIFVISSRFLADWIRKNFPTMVLPMLEKDLPEFVGGLPKSQISKFLRGLFDAEGAIGMQAGQISLGMVSKQIIQKVQLLLLRFGVLSTYSESIRKRRNWNNVSRLSINDKESMKNFEKEVGFSSLNKQKTLRLLINSKKYFNYKYFSFPIRLDSFYYNYLRPTKIKGWHKIGLKPQRSYLTNYRLDKILKWINQNGKFIKESTKVEDVIRCVKKFINSDIVWVRPKITQIPSPYRFVYDLEVNPSSNFIGNGMLQHNSRWATHGSPNQINAHPHIDCKGEIAIVHNGIIENYAQLKNQLVKEGHKFRSQTDTEVIAHLLEKFYKNIPLEEAVRRAVSKLTGSFAIGVISKKEPDKLIGARLGSPLIVGLGRNENFLASDAPAVLGSTRDIIFLDEKEMVALTKDSYKITDFNGKKVSKKTTRIDWDVAQAQKQGYKHFMLKEINEQPKISDNFLNMRIQQNRDQIIFEELKISKDRLKRIKNISIVACGT
ncbi:MAG: helix-turn-helix domain-containing protein, partial [Candidatus Omnitrophica bacterium]|nr:helix-turn-helix domain-containing protein [Candidatus Omnitrophota bacterium]